LLRIEREVEDDLYIRLGEQRRKILTSEITSMDRGLPGPERFQKGRAA
jgi:hypothetical protein